MVEQQKIDIAEESTTKSTIEKKETATQQTSSTIEKEEKWQDNVAGIEAEELAI
jgi:hypothetical protein